MALCCQVQLRRRASRQLQLQQRGQQGVTWMARDTGQDGSILSRLDGISNAKEKRCSTG